MHEKTTVMTFSEKKKVLVLNTNGLNVPKDKETTILVKWSKCS